MKTILLGCLICLAFAAGNAEAQDSAREALKIRYLISAVENLQGATFIRNGGEYDATAAANHLRFKLKLTRLWVKTAEDFIRLCGSRSSLSGEAYRIRFADGTTVTAGAFFQDKLKTFPAEKP